MDPRVRRALQIVGALVLVAALLVAGGFAYFAATFGSADHTQFTLTAEQLPRDRVAENATAYLSPRAAAVVDEARHNGTARIVAKRLDLDGAYVERNGTYYRVRAERGSDVTRQRPVVTIEAVDDPDGDVVPADDLPSADERAFLAAWRAWTIRNTDRGSGDPPVRYVYETVPDAEDSVFVPTQELRYVQRENRTFRVSVRNESVSLDTTAYRLDRIAESESAFVETLVRNVTGRLNESAAEPLDRAIANGTYVSRAHEYGDAARPIRPVAEAVGFGDPGDFLYEDSKVVQYVRYEGSYYRLTLTGYTTAA